MRQGISAGDLTNRINKRFLFADYTRQVEAAKLGIKIPINIQGLNGGTNQSSALQNIVEGAQYTTAAEQQTYINEVLELAPASVRELELEPEIETEPGSDPGFESGSEPGTQILLNSDFIDFNPTTGAASNWSSSINWNAWQYQVGTRPTTVASMPSRPGVWATSESNGFIIFTYNTATISQTVNLTGLDGIESIRGVLNIVASTNNINPGRPNGGNDQFNFTVTFKGSGGNTLYTLTTGITTAPTSWTDYTLTLNRTGNANFDNIRSITVAIYGIDNGYWAGQYGPAMDYCTLTLLN
jgi:hypothetical protein